MRLSPAAFLSCSSITAGYPLPGHPGQRGMGAMQGFILKIQGAIPVKTAAELASKQHRMGMLKVGMERPQMWQPVVPRSDLARITPAGIFSQELEFYSTKNWCFFLPPQLYLLIRTHEYFIVWLITHYRFEVVTHTVDYEQTHWVGRMEQGHELGWGPNRKGWVAEVL